MKETFNIYAIYDKEKDAYRSDLTTRARKYYDHAKNAQNAIDGYLCMSRNEGIDPNRFEVREISCRDAKNTTQYKLEYVDLFEATYVCTKCGCRETVYCKTPTWHYCKTCGRKITNITEDGVIEEVKE